MIQVRMYFVEADGSLHLRMEGHAGCGEKGRDLVCAGVSTLAYTLGEAVERLYHQQMLRRCPRIELEEGRAEIIAQPKPEYIPEVMMVYWVIEAGLHALGQSFPEGMNMEETIQLKGA